jgi:hypothetical protein
MHNKIDVPKKSKRLIIWNGWSIQLGKNKSKKKNQNQKVTYLMLTSYHTTGSKTCKLAVWCRNGTNTPRTKLVLHWKMWGKKLRFLLALFCWTTNLPRTSLDSSILHVTAFWLQRNTSRARYHILHMHTEAAHLNLNKTKYVIPISTVGSALKSSSSSSYFASCHSHQSLILTRTQN